MIKKNFKKKKLKIKKRFKIYIVKSIDILFKQKIFICTKI